MGTVDSHSPPGAWQRELRARGIYTCSTCGWTGRTPSLSDTSELRWRDDDWVMDRTHIPICPRCFEEVRK